MIRFGGLSLVVAAALGLAAGAARADTITFTDFEGFTTGASVDGQGGWSAAAKYDESVELDGLNTVWRVSNAVTAGSFGDMPYSPRPGGIPASPTTDPDNSMPDAFAGESSTGAAHARFFGSFLFKMTSRNSVAGTRLTVSADNGQGARQSFLAIEDDGGNLDLSTFDVDATGAFVGPLPLVSDLAYDTWHTFGVEVLFLDGLDDDVVNYYVNGALVHSNGSWEEFYRNHQAALHALGVPVQSLLFRISGNDEPLALGKGFFIDDVQTVVGAVPEPALGLLLLAAFAGVAFLRRR